VLCAATNKKMLCGIPGERGGGLVSPPTCLTGNGSEQCFSFSFFGEIPPLGDYYKGLSGKKIPQIRHISRGKFSEFAIFRM
jgi:hypothetical protein